MWAICKMERRFRTGGFLYPGLLKRGLIFADFLKYRIVIRELSFCFLIAVYEKTVDVDLKYPMVSFNECRTETEIFFNGGGQTGRHRQKASLYAVGNVDGDRLLVAHFLDLCSFEEIVILMLADLCTL